MRKLIGIILVVLLATLISGNVFAASKSTTMHASTRVVAYAKHNVLHQENTLTITSKDIERGYKEISKATVLSVQTNSLNGYLMNLFVGDNFFSNVTLNDGLNKYSISELGGEVHFPYEGKIYVTKELSFRFDLLTNVKPGTYQWPVAFMISPM